MYSDYVSCLSSRGFHRMHYVEWGDPAAERIVICVHGLTRNGRDFDVLAQALPEFRVVCPDIVGRGRSDWLEVKEDYGPAQYCADLVALIARVTAPNGGGSRRLYWVGSSMGGIVGMLFAARSGSPIEKLLLNDVGALIPAAALQRIGTYVGQDPRFGSYRELEACIRIACAPFGKLTDAQWRQLIEHGVKQHPDGTWGLSYDPGIGVAFRQAQAADVDMWPVYDAIRCPTLLMRGAESDVLTRETALAMTQRGPRPALIEFEGIGHLPMFMNSREIEAARRFLLAP